MSVLDVVHQRLARLAALAPKAQAFVLGTLTHLEFYVRLGYANFLDNLQAGPQGL